MSSSGLNFRAMENLAIFGGSVAMGLVGAGAGMAAETVLNKAAGTRLTGQVAIVGALCGLGFVLYAGFVKDRQH